MHVTLFADQHATRCTARDVTLADLQTLALNTRAPAKAALPWLKLASFGDRPTPRGSLRNNANVLAISGVEADYDQGKVSVAEAARLLKAAGIEALIYTSPSHLEDLPRWRVLCPTSHPLPGASRAELVGRLNYVLGGVLATESFTLSQAYYYGQTPDSLDPEAVIVPGQPIDLVDFPARYPERRAAEPLALPPAAPGQTPDQRTAQALAAACAAFDGSSDAGRHHILLSATNTLAPFVRSGHLDLDDAQEHLRDAMATSGRDANPGEIEGAMAGALRNAQPYVPETGGAEFDPLPELPTDAETRRLLEFTEDHAARMFAATQHTSFRFDHSESKWYGFTPGVGWADDQKAGVVNTSRNFLHAAREQWGLEAKEAIKAASSSFVHNVISLAKSDPLMATTSAEWDLDHMALGVPGGHVDLRTGAMHRADASRLMRRRCSVAPAGGSAPVWFRFLDEATGHDPKLVAWLQRFAGYVLTGDVSEEMLAFVYGPGKNGKGVFLRTLSSVLGNYAYQAPAALFDASARQNPEYQLAKLEGIRLLMVSETEAGSMLAEAFVKEITGNEGKLNARHPYGRPFEFRSQAKVLIVGNHAPKLTGRSEAMERRLRVVPFNNKPPAPDPTLKDRLVPEYPMILQWMVDGCMAWQRERLGVCDAVMGASRAYFEEQDTLAQWVAERCDTSDTMARTPSTELMDDWNAWLRQRGEKPVNSRDFKEAMTQRMPQFPYARSAKGVVVSGLSLSVAFCSMLE